MQCNSVQCSAVQCNSVQCNSVQCTSNSVWCSRVVQCNSCSVVQCNSVQCSDVQSSGVQFSTIDYSTAQHSTVLHHAMQRTVQYGAVHVYNMAVYFVHCSNWESKTAQLWSLQQDVLYQPRFEATQTDPSGLETFYVWGLYPGVSLLLVDCWSGP